MSTLDLYSITTVKHVRSNLSVVSSHVVAVCRLFEPSTFALRPSFRHSFAPISLSLLFPTTLYRSNRLKLSNLIRRALSNLIPVTKLNTKLNYVKSYFLRSLKKRKKNIEFLFETFLKFPNSCTYVRNSRRNFTQTSQLTIIFHSPRFTTRVDNHRNPRRGNIYSVTPREQGFGPTFLSAVANRPLVNYPPRFRW